MSAQNRLYPTTLVLDTRNGDIEELPIPSWYAYGSDPSPGKLGRVYVSREIADVLVEAQEHLRALHGKLSFVVLDGYRGVVHQAALYLQAAMQLKTRGITGVTDRYAANPVHRPTGGHLVGGAVDVVLAKTPVTPDDVYEPYAQELADYDSFGDKMHTNHLDDAGNRSTPELERAWFRRSLVKDVMEKAGAVSYPWEFSHFEVGTAYASMVNARHKSRLISQPRMLQEHLAPVPHGVESNLLRVVEMVS